MSTPSPSTSTSTSTSIEVLYFLLTVTVTVTVSYTSSGREFNTPQGRYLILILKLAVHCTLYIESTITMNQ